MKKILLFLFFIPFAGLLKAQNLSADHAKQLVQKNSKAVGINQADLNDALVSSAYFNKSAGTEMVYLIQGYKGIPVYNQILVLAFKNGKLVSNAGSFVPNADKLINMPTAVPAVSPSAAVRTGFSEVKVSAPGLIAPLTSENSGKKLDFGIVKGTYEKVRAELIWLPVSVNKKTSLKLTWNVFVAPDKTDEYWSIMVDAATNTILGKTNMTINETFVDKHREVTTGINLPRFAVDASQVKPPSVFNSPSLVSTSNYLVIPYPYNSALYVVPTLATNPWTLAGATNANATSLGWQNDGTVDYTISRGNNAWATEDRAATNTNSGVPATSTTTPDPLNFIFTPDYTQAPTVTANQRFGTTNLFYWNNIMHDMSYNYGFDEVAGNFQASNQGRGGLGNDHVIALAQSGAGTNNANFLTPVDGQRGRMRMYLFTSPNPDRDGDIDNGVISHEYTHGISTRLTGGPANSSCLNNSEEGGEGWSDYFSLMVTTDWSTATATDGFNIKRPVGNWVLGQGVTGGGIRAYPYSTNLAVNPWTYAGVASSGGEVHDIGEIWCVTLWDMTWALIQTDGINPNLFNASGAGGNSIAMHLVTEGMRLQPCSPGFLDARDAILKADQNLYGGVHRCTIIAAFARRGMGLDAKQGSSNSTSDQVVGFSTSEPPTLALTESVTQQLEGQNITYTNKITTGACAGSEIANYILRDTLPANVTYVSGGTYNATTREVSFAVTMAAGQTQNYQFTVQVNAGTWFPTVDLLNEPVAGTTIPATWTATATTGPSNWLVSTTVSHSAPNSFFAVDNTTAITDFSLATTSSIALGVSPPALTFWHNYNTEATWDGGVVEISTNGGSTWTDLGPKMVSNGYNSSFAAGTTLEGRAAFTGTSNGFVQTKVNLAAYANQNAKFRFRALSDDNTGIVGWYVDDILLRSSPVINMHTTFLNGTGVIVSVADTVADIIQTTGSCVNTSITTQPGNTAACAGSDATITVVAGGTTPTYQWQVSTNSGTTWTDITGATSATLNLPAVTAAMTNNQYRVIVSNTCPSTVTSNAVILTVTDAAVITAQPVSAKVCSGSNASFVVTATGSNLSYQWQVSTDGGTTFTDITGQTTNTLTLTSVSTALNLNKYRASVKSCNPAGILSDVASLTVDSAVNITSQPADKVVCEGSNTSFTVAATGTAATYQWQVSTDGGTSWTNVPAATSATLTITAPAVALNGTRYRAVVTGTCSPSGLNSASALLTVNSLVTISAQPVSVEICAPGGTAFSVTAAGSGLTYQWQVMVVGTTTWTDIPGATSNTYTLGATTPSLNGNQYRAVLNGTCTSNLNSTAVTLKVNTPVGITAQPVAVKTCVGTNAVFAITATGTSITYQWQVSINGGAFVNVADGGPYSGATTNQLSIAQTGTVQSGNVYRVIASGVPCGQVVSSTALLTVNPLPSVVATVSSYGNITPYVQTEVSATISPMGVYSIQWYKNNTALAGVTTAVVPVNVDGFGDYKVMVTDVNGCSATSNIVAVHDSASSLLFVYPNPNRGIFQVRYYNAAATSVGRTMKIYNSHGELVFSKAYTVTGAYGRMDVNISNLSADVYFIDLRDASGKRLGDGKVSVTH